MTDPCFFCFNFFCADNKTFIDSLPNRLLISIKFSDIYSRVPCQDCYNELKSKSILIGLVNLDILLIKKNKFVEGPSGCSQCAYIANTLDFNRIIGREVDMSVPIPDSDPESYHQEHYFGKMLMDKNTLQSQLPCYFCGQKKKKRIRKKINNKPKLEQENNLSDK